MHSHVPGLGPVAAPDELFSVGLVPVVGGVLPLGLASEGGGVPTPELPSEPEDGDPLSPEVPAGAGGGFSLGLTSVGGGVLSSGLV